MASISLRPFESRDRGFVIMSFVRSFGRSAYAAGVPAAVLIDLLDPLLIAWDTAVAEAPDGELLGWSCSRLPGDLAWLYVKPSFRRHGVARALLEHAKVGRALAMPFVPTKAPDGTSFATFVKRLGYTVHFRPYLPLVEVHGVAVGPR